MIYPKTLNKGDTIGILAPSSPLKKYSLETIKKTLNNYGYKVIFGESCHKSYKGYLSGDDNIRVDDINNMFLDKSIDAIFCLRGGYGTPRILDMIDYSIVKNNPKIFVGFSDITALHIAFNQKSDLVTFHGPMSGNSIEWDEFTYKSLIDTLNKKENLNIKNPSNEKIKTVVKGNCEGILTGGNLSLIAATMGTKFEIDTRGKILFIEEVGEKIYQIDKMLTQLALANKFNECIGIIFGDFKDCNSTKGEFTVEEIIKDRVEKYNKPCIYNLKSGHCMPMITLGLGYKYSLDATNKILKLIT